MRKRQFVRWGVAVALLVTASQALAAPVPTSTTLLKSTVASDVTEVRWHGHGHGGAGVAAGILGGMILGGIIASQPYYYGPPPGYYGYAGPPDWLAYCSSRYRSFDPASGTYLGYDGLRHPCQ